MSRSLSPNPWRNLAGVLAVNTAVGLALFVLLHSWRIRSGVEGFVEVLVRNQIFAHSIGGLCALLIPPVAIRLSRARPWVLWPAYVTFLVGVASAGTLLACLVTAWIGYIPSHAVLKVFLQNLGFTSLISLSIGIASFLFARQQSRQNRIAIALKDQQLAREEAERLAAELQLESLQSRLQPHFLFNTINSVLSLIREDPEAAERMLERLSRLLRFALETQERGTVTLAEELKLVNDYLLIEQARFGARLRFSVDTAESEGQFEIPPFAVQTLVENSMKYVVARRREGGRIEVRVAGIGGRLELEVIDDGPGFTREQITPGHGLDVLERRLRLLYGSDGRMEIGGAEGGRVRLLIPARVPVSVKP